MASSDNISKEIQASQYYVHNSYVNSYYAVYKFVEKWVAENVFRQDTSRVFLASNDYVFRRRFELTDTSQDYSTLDLSSLRFPFANYWPQNSAWIVDPRIAAKQASLNYIGIYEGNTKLQASQSLFNIPVTFWFDREDDARLAYDILYFKSYNEHYYTSVVPYGRDNTLQDNKGSSSTLLSLPMNLLIEDLKFNPEFNESNWLKQQRVFTITTDFRVRSYAIIPPKQPKYDVTLESGNFLSDGSSYDDGISYYHIVDDVILNFNNPERLAKTYDAGFDPISQTYKGSTKFPSEGSVDTIYVDSYKKNVSPSSLNIYLWDYTQGKYIVPEYQLDSMSIRVSGDYNESSLDITKFDCITNITQTTNTLEWSYGKSTMSASDYDNLVSSSKEYSRSKSYKIGDYCLYNGDLYKCIHAISKEKWDDSCWIMIDSVIDSIELHITGNSEFISIDPSNLSYKLNKLKSNSQYYGYIVFIGRTGMSKKFVISFTTKSGKKTMETLNSLVGTTW